MTLFPSPPRGPVGWPIVGNAVSLSHGRLEFLRACAIRYGDLVPLRLFRKQILFVNHPEYIGEVLATNHTRVAKDVARRADYVLIGAGLSLSEGDAWRRERRMIQPSFHHERAATADAVMVALAERAIEHWREGETRNICVDMGRLTLEIAAAALFGIDPAENAELLAALARALAHRAARVRSLQLFLPDRLPTPAKLRLRRARRRIDELVGRIIEDRRAGSDDRGDVLSALLGARDAEGRALTKEQVCNEVLTVLVGANETVADLLSWTWYYLSRHPDVETRLAGELKTVLDGRSPRITDLPRLRYTGMVMSEVLRLNPPAPALAREAIADFKVGGFLIRRGMGIVVSQWVMHRDPRYFARPEVFDPDRWADDFAGRLPRYAYFPFGAGPRLCIGRSFAMAEAILALASIARRFRLELVPGHSVIADAVPTLHPKHGLCMTVRRRELDGVGR